MCVYVYVCVCLYVHTHICSYIGAVVSNIYICVCLCICTHTHMQLCWSSGWYIYISVCVCVYVHTDMCRYVGAVVGIYLYLCVFVYMHTHTYAGMWGQWLVTFEDTEGETPSPIRKRALPTSTEEPYQYLQKSPIRKRMCIYKYTEREYSLSFCLRVLYIHGR